MNQRLISPPVARIDSDQTPGPGPWVRQAACAGLPTSYFFSDDPDDVKLALAVCRPCPVRDDCAAYALAIPILDGVWGGMTEADRRRIVRRRHERNSEDRSRIARHEGLPGAAHGSPRCRT